MNRGINVLVRRRKTKIGRDSGYFINKHYSKVQKSARKTIEKRKFGKEFHKKKH
jgi:hypothetical protein